MPHTNIPIEERNEIIKTVFIEYLTDYELFTDRIGLDTFVWFLMKIQQDRRAPSVENTKILRMIRKHKPDLYLLVKPWVDGPTNENS